MSACVSPPQLTSSYIVQTTASMAQAASMALPPRSNVRAPAIAPSGLPVMAIQCRPWSGGLCVAEYGSGVAARQEKVKQTRNQGNEVANVFMVGPQGYAGCLAPPRTDDRRIDRRWWSESYRFGYALGSDACDRLREATRVVAGTGSDPV